MSLELELGRREGHGSSLDSSPWRLRGKQVVDGAVAATNSWQRSRCPSDRGREYNRAVARGKAAYAAYEVFRSHHQPITQTRCVLVVTASVALIAGVGNSAVFGFTTIALAALLCGAMCAVTALALSISERASRSTDLVASVLSTCLALAVDCAAHVEYTEARVGGRDALLSTPKPQRNESKSASLLLRFHNPLTAKSGSRSRPAGTRQVHPM